MTALIPKIRSLAVDGGFKKSFPFMTREGWKVFDFSDFADMDRIFNDMVTKYVEFFYRFSSADFGPQVLSFFPNKILKYGEIYSHLLQNGSRQQLPSSPKIFSTSGLPSTSNNHVHISTKIDMNIQRKSEKER